VDSREGEFRGSSGRTASGRSSTSTKQHPEDSVLEKSISPWITAALAAGAVLWQVVWECVAWAVRGKPRAAPALRS